MLQALIDSVATEPGFPSYADYHAAPAALPPSPDTAPAAYPPSPDTAPGLYGPSGFGRACGEAGYQRGRGADPSAAAVLTNLAAASQAPYRRYLLTRTLTSTLTLTLTLTLT